RPQTVLVLGPMYHLNGFYGLFNLVAGDRLVVLEAFDASRAVDAIERHRISTFYCTPTMLKRMADLPGIDERDLSSIEWMCQGAAPMPPYLVHRWAELVGPERLLMAYGMSEGLGITAIRADEWMAHEGSVGRPARDTEVGGPDRDRRRQRLPGRGRDRPDGPPQDRGRRRHRREGRRVGPPGARHHRAGRRVGPAHLRRDPGVRQRTAESIQGSEVDRDRRGHP